MTEPARKLTFTFAEYLKQEKQSQIKHELLDGEIFAMAGGTIEHARLASKIDRLLGNQLQGRPCEAFSSDLRIRVLATGLGTYPDLSIVCGHIETDPEDRDTLVNPIVLVEVLSDSTEAHDRGDKFAHYRRIPSLREYVLVSQHEPRIEVFRRNEGGSWTLYEAGQGQVAKLASIDCQLAVDEVYENALQSTAGG
jgi:Uma2 family endonuclease